MILRKLVRMSLVAASLCALALSQAQAQWTITTYKQNPSLIHPEITTMAIADEYFAGTRPTRFVGTSTVPQVDLAEGTGGQFAINHPFPGIDNLPAVGDTNDYTARITGTLVVNTAASYDFFTDSDDGNRFRLDINRNGTFEANESIVPDGGLQGAGMPERSTGLRNGVVDPGFFPAGISLATGNYPFEASFYERGGGANFDAGYNVNGSTTQFVLGNAAGGIGLLGGSANVRNVGANVSGTLTNFAQANALRTVPNQPGFPQSGVFEVFNIQDSGGDGDFLNDSGAPGLGAPNANDDDDFLVVGQWTSHRSGGRRHGTIPLQHRRRWATVDRP